ncbi:alpha/beta hydrolase [Gillisia limnaea]|nr:alpha/beta hydrolase [Gillisia limnaea]
MKKKSKLRVYAYPRIKKYCSIIIVPIVLFILNSCSVKKYENISYLENSSIAVPPTLNIFSSKKEKNQNSPVLIFVHGGNWNSGKKEFYNFFGNNFARKGVTVVIVGYTLSPDANYDEMAKQTAQAIKWTKNNISQFDGDPGQLFLTGHSAGGHLVALTTLNPKYEIDPATVSGIILNDAAGLDMHHYLQNNPPTTRDNYLTTWSSDQENWKKASPIYYLDENTPPFLIYLGEKTYPSITTANRRFLQELKSFQPDAEFILLNKKHVPMMTQYLWPWNKRYREIMNFMELQD